MVYSHRDRHCYRGHGIIEIFYMLVCFAFLQIWQASDDEHKVQEKPSLRKIVLWKIFDAEGSVFCHASLPAGAKERHRGESSVPFFVKI